MFVYCLCIVDTGRPQWFSVDISILKQDCVVFYLEMINHQNHFYDSFPFNKEKVPPAADTAPPSGLV